MVSSCDMLNGEKPASEAEFGTTGHLQSPGLTASELLFPPSLMAMRLLNPDQCSTFVALWLDVPHSHPSQSVSKVKLIPITLCHPLPPGGCSLWESAASPGG